MRAFTLCLALLAFSSFARGEEKDLRDQPAVEKGRLRFGTAAEMQTAEKNPGYLDVLAREFNLVTPEWTMKMHPTQTNEASAFSADPKAWNFTAFDALLSFAQAHHQKVRGHTLVWGEALPDWMKQKKFTAPQLAQIMENRISTVMRHNEEDFPGLVLAYDVVNEAVSEGCDNVWSKVENPDGKKDDCLKFVAAAFRIARKVAKEINPQIRLFYNDYGFEGLSAPCEKAWFPSKACKVLALVKSLKAEGLVDGVGFQMHLGPHGVSPEDLSRNIAEYEKLGLKVQLTELDYASRSKPGADWEERQAKVFKDVAQVCLSHPNCDAIVTWGFLDSTSWEVHQGKYSPLYFAEGWRKKPAYRAFHEALQTFP